MPDRHDQDHEPIVRDLVQRSIVADPKAPHVVGASQLHAAGPSRLDGKPVNGASDATLDGSVEPCQLPRGRGQELDREHRRLQVELSR